MNKNFKSVKATLIMGILLVSLFVAVSPKTSAGIAVNLQSYVTVDWKTGVPKVTPRGDPQTFDLDITYGVSSGGLAKTLSKFLNGIYGGDQVIIKLDIVDSSPWCTASLPQDTITTEVPEPGKTKGNLTARVTIQANLDAPAYAFGSIVLKVSVPKIGLIESFEKEIDLNFNPLYLPLIDAQPTETNTKTIGPMDTAVFPIEVNNMANARTKVFLEVVNVPEGWIAVVTDEITLDENGGKGIAYLTVKPPKGFGYHYEEANIRVQMTPARAEDISDRGEPQYLTFVVENRGFSFIGIEVILPIIILIIVILFLAYYFLIKRKQKA